MKQSSLTSTILGVMLILITLSSGLATFAIANLVYSLGDAKAINAAGSLRMQSYRLMVYANVDNPKAIRKILEFEKTLYSDELKHAVSWSVPKTLSNQYLIVVSKWQAMKFYIEQENPKMYAEALKEFVGSIGLLVRKMQQHAEFKLKILAISQFSGLAVMLLVAFLAVIYIRKKVVSPLLQMMHSAESISKGEFELAMPKTRYIELTSLSNALQNTARELSTLYHNLESQVEEKTQALTATHKELAFLYDSLMILHTKPIDRQSLTEVLSLFKRYQNCHYVRLLLKYGENSTEIITSDNGWPNLKTLPPVSIPLKYENAELGVLQIIPASEPNQTLLKNFAMMLARSMVIRNSEKQRQQLALMEERNIIARELHDSIGQVLSFLKIQINLLGKSLPKEYQNQAIEQHMREIKEGINTAYSQLRELLSTFRLVIKEPDLSSAMESMLDQLRAQTDILITLDYQLPSQLLGADQHIHVLQLTREAVLNAIKHAKSSHIGIYCKMVDDNMLHIDISDNGIGLAHLQERDRHFGISIMHERASKLAGTVEFTSNAEGGTTVCLSFPPQEISPYE